MAFADAAFVRVAERDHLSRILTVDAHFVVYTLPRRSPFVVLPGWPNAPPGRARVGPPPRYLTNLTNIAPRW
jgi:hypothetical protein